MIPLSLSEASIQRRTSTAKTARSPCTDPPGSRDSRGAESGGASSAAGAADPAAVAALVERYDAVKFGIFQRNLSNFRGLVLFCIEADFATKYSFFSILRDLQDLHTFAPLQTQNLRKNSSNFFRILARISAKILIFRQFSSNFAQILMIFFSEFRRTF